MSKAGQQFIESATQAMYYTICETTCPDDFNAIMGMLDDDSYPYSKAQLQSACAECAYIIEHDELPAWATVIEAFECDEDSYRFLYVDPRVNQ